jgi:citrate synthase
MLPTEFNTLDDKYSEITPEIEAMSRLCVENSTIDTELYTKYQVNRGLRDLNGNGVLTGLTEISDIQSFDTSTGKKIPMDGRLFFRGVDVEDLVQGFISEKRFGFEETTYLLIFGKLPDSRQLRDFTLLLEKYRTLPTSFVRDIIMKAPSSDMMNTLARSVLTLHAYDAKANDVSIPNVLRQSLLLTAVFPLLSVYGYQAFRHYFAGDDFYIHTPKSGLSTAENILQMLRRDGKYSTLEAQILDVALVLHAEHGGGNNSTFAVHLVSSADTDTFSAITAGIQSLKGFKHGGANIKVMGMMEDIKRNVKMWESEGEVAAYLASILRGEAYDGSGLIYGQGHAVYTKSDPRARLLRDKAAALAGEKGLVREFNLYQLIEKLTPEVFRNVKGSTKDICSNVDFYSGFVYKMLGIPPELYTPLFAVSRVAGWCAHRMEEIIAGGRIIRPAYKCVQPRLEYVPLAERMKPKG